MTAHRHLALAWGVFTASVCLACATNEPSLQPELETPSSPSDDDGASSPDVVEDQAEVDPEVDIDLSESGMAATIRAPESAAVRATADEIEIVGGPHYHLLIGRGRVEPLGEKARIVRKWDGEFRRFLADEQELVVYETGTPKEQRYHFFMNGAEHGEPYHCRTPDDGIDEREAVDHMIEACRDVKFSAEVALDTAP